MMIFEKKSLIFSEKPKKIIQILKFSHFEKILQNLEKCPFKILNLTKC